MSKKRVQRTLNLAAAGAISAAAMIGGWGWFSLWQEDSQAQQQNDSANIRGDRPSTSNDIVSKAKNDVENKDSKNPAMASNVWGRSLQHGFRLESSASTTPQKPPIVEAIVQAPPPLPVPLVNDLGLRLVGTVIEEGRSMAIAIDGLGTLDFRREGDLLRLQPDGVRIDKVSKESVLVSYQGKSSNWQMGQSLQFQVAGIAMPPEPMVPAMDSTSLDSTSNSMSLDQPNIPAPAKMSVEDELESLNGLTPLDPF